MRQPDVRQPHHQADRDDDGVSAAAEKALELVHDGARVGLGSGNAARVFTSALGKRVREGLRVTCVPTSRASADQAKQAGIPLIALGGALDITVDGADEVSPALDLVKGRGGAFVRERIVAAASKRQVILIGKQKLVDRLGQLGRIPVEVIPLAEWSATRALESLDLVPSLRMNETGQPFVSENGNLIFDCTPSAPLRDGVAARALEQAMRAIAGVVDTGLFLGTAERVIVGHTGGRVDVLIRSWGSDSRRKPNGAK
ncbi:MAG TPA: ribose-5-phosphate isomerase RpiA [Gemmatimonadaceae bacterium]|nr:ribose-5-phosphate isomerase RpiA [Gemmatimonadaceae bacterium]